MPQEAAPLSAPSWGALLRHGRLAHTLLLTLGVGVHAIDVFIIASVLPSVVVDIGGAAFYTWSTMLYIVASILGTACGGFVRARCDLRRAYLAGTLVFLTGSAGCAVAPSMAWLLLARAGQGLGGGMLIALSYGMVGELYPAELRSRAFSLISGMWGTAALLGPTVGGIFAAIGWWRGAFWVATPVIMGLMGLAWGTLPATAGPHVTARLPWERLLLLGLGVLCVAYSAQVVALWLRLGLIAAGGVMLGLTFRIDAQALSQMFPSQPLSLHHPVGTAYWMFFLLDVTSSQVTVFIPLVVQVLHGVSPLGAGYFAALRSLAWTLAALGSAGLRDRWVRLVLWAGPLLITCSIAGQAAVVVNGSPLWLIIFIALHGIGIGLCFAHLSSWTIAAARPGEEHLTASSIATVRSLGQACGAAAAGLVANAAGLAQGISVATVASAATWVYGLGTFVPVALTVLALRLLWLYRQSSLPYDAQDTPQPGKVAPQE
jgi:MFS family permease